jgi:predicted metal-dependent hydrolase
MDPGPELADETGSRPRDPRYLGFFECFNSGRFYEAHDVLEALWLPVRTGPDGAFYKGLIQLAGAFVHVQKGRLVPAIALLRRARFHLESYSEGHLGLKRAVAFELIDRWVEVLEGRSPTDGHPLARQSPRLPLP